MNKITLSYPTDPNFDPEHIIAGIKSGLSSCIFKHLTNNEKFGILLHLTLSGSEEDDDGECEILISQRHFVSSPFNENIAIAAIRASIESPEFKNHIDISELRPIVHFKMYIMESVKDMEP